MGRQKRITRGVHLAVLIALTLLVLACIVSEQTSDGRPTPVVTRMVGLRMGPLTSVDGCPRIGDIETGRVVVWPPDFEVSSEGDLLWVFYDDHGVELRLGQAVSLVGGEVTSIDHLDAQTRQQVPAGCPGPYWLVGGIRPAGRTASSSLSDGLVGTEWRLVSLNGKRPIKGTEITLNFEEDHLAGSMPCAAYGGDPESGGYGATDDGRLSVSRPLGVSKTGCSESGNAAEQREDYRAALQRSAAYQLAFDSLQITDWPTIPAGASTIPLVESVWQSIGGRSEASR